MAFNLLKSFLPDQPTLVRVWRGPLRGARVVMNPRHSCRKILGLYEHELNGWLEAVLLRVRHVVDVGANDGYFTFGCAAAFRRLGKSGEIVAFEPDEQHFRTLQRSFHRQTKSPVQITLVQRLVGRETKPGMTNLDAIRWTMGDTNDRTNTLLKIDVEGAEEEVLAGASTWLNSSNCFLIEIHKERYLESIAQVFANKGLILDRVDQHPLWMIGREVRDKENWWLLSRLDCVR
jgi:Methyltransferase FkbM domain